VIAADYLEAVRKNVPPQLLPLHVWLLWRRVSGAPGEKPKKVPFYADGNPRSGRLDSPEDRSHLVDFEVAAAALNGHHAGLGIALGAVPGEEIHLSGIDLDHVYRDNQLDPRAVDVIAAAESFTERSPSGDGLHIVGLGNVGTLKKDARGLEIYSGGRFFTVTGNPINRAGLADLTEAAKRARELFGAETAQADTGELSKGATYILQGGRNSYLSDEAFRLRKQGASVEQITDVLCAINVARCRPPLPESEVRQIAAGKEGIEAEPEKDDPLELVRVAIVADLNAGPDAVDAAEPPRFVSYPRLPVAGGNIAAPGATGKTVLAINEKVHVTCGGKLYDSDVLMQGSCVLVTAEDGADHARYVLQQVLKDGIETGQLPERAAQRAKHDIKIIDWKRASYGPIVRVSDTGDMSRAPVFDLLLELLAPIQPVYVTLDPAVLFGPGERYGNDGDAFLASMLHEAARALVCCFQTTDHVSQTVFRDGIVDQYAARGGTAKTDNARLARQLVRVATAPNLAGLPLSVSGQEIQEGRILQLHWTKLNFAQKPPPVWLRRHRYWIEWLRAPTEEQRTALAEQQSESEDAETLEANVAAIIEYIRKQLATGSGIRLSARDVVQADPGPRHKGQKIARDKRRDAINHALAHGRLKHLDLPDSESWGRRQQYLAPVDYEPPPPEATP
jgi:hypothetical protein